MTDQSRQATDRAAQPDPTPMGALFHTEIRSDDPPATMRFLERVFGWGVSASPSPIRFILELPGPGEGHLGPPSAGETPGAVPYVLVDDLGATSTRIEEAGGEVDGGIQLTPQGRYITFRPPGGPAMIAWQGPDAD